MRGCNLAFSEDLRSKSFVSVLATAAGRCGGSRGWVWDCTFTHHRTRRLVALGDGNNHSIYREKAAASKLPASLSQSKHISQLPEMPEGQTHSEPVHLLHTTRCEHGPRTPQSPTATLSYLVVCPALEPCRHEGCTGSFSFLFQALSHGPHVPCELDHIFSLASLLPCY
jgi:hypothetical protein